MVHKGKLPRPVIYIFHLRWFFRYVYPRPRKAGVYWFPVFAFLSLKFFPKPWATVVAALSRPLRAEHAPVGTSLDTAETRVRLATARRHALARTRSGLRAREYFTPTHLEFATANAAVQSVRAEPSHSDRTKMIGAQSCSHDWKAKLLKYR